MNTTRSDRQLPCRVHDRLRDFNVLLTDLLRLHEELVVVIQKKLVVMRQSEVNNIYECLRAEEDLVRRIHDKEHLRRRLVALIAEDLGITDAMGGEVSAATLIKHLAPPTKLRTAALAGQLSHIMREVAKVNGVVARFAREMLQHYRGIFQQVTESINEISTYALGGQVQSNVRAQVVDATG